MKRSFKIRGLKKVLKVFLVSFLLMSFKNVYAKMLTIEEVKDNLYTKDSVTIDTSKNELILIISGEQFPFKYNDKEIYYDSSVLENVCGTENLKEGFRVVAIGDIEEAILKLSGYDGKDLSDTYLNSDYNTYGLLFDFEDCVFDSNTENTSSHVAYSYAKHFKISLDTDKIDALVKKYGMPSNEEILTYNPTLKADKITDHSVNLYPNIEFELKDVKAYCNIYRADSENGEYKKINSEQVICTNWGAFVDDNLKPGQNYFYKAVVTSGDKEGNASNIVKIKTTGTSSSQDDNLPENPKTGTYIPIIFLTLIGTSGIFILIYTKKHNVIRKI